MKPAGEVISRVFAGFHLSAFRIVRQCSCIEEQMPIQRNFLKYHESIAAELRYAKDRIRDLIGDKHWLTDGEHKEAILRKTLRDHISETLHVGRGFVCGPEASSHQIDILISSRDKPILFGDRELRLVTPDVVVAIIEVKTQIQIKNLEKILEKLADDAEMIRTNSDQPCGTGLFVYEKTRNDSQERVLQCLGSVTRHNDNRVINWVALGPDVFVRYWHDGRAVESPVQGPVWHSYVLPDLAHAYFLSNVVWDTCAQPNQDMQFAWFPVEGGKENYRQWCLGLNDLDMRFIG
jgi:hypothetical protein